MYLGKVIGRVETMTVDPAFGATAWTPWTDGPAQAIEVFSRTQPAGYALRIRESDCYEPRFLRGPDTNFKLHVFSLAHPEISGNPKYSGSNFFSFIKTPRASTRKAKSDANGSEISFSLVIHATGFRSTTRISISEGNFRTICTSSV